MSNLDNSRTKNVVSNLVSQARESDQDDEDRRLVSCDLCFQPLRRCVGVSCCPASLVCRICAVAHISRHAHCWVCGAKADTQVRGFFKDFFLHYFLVYWIVINLMRRDLLRYILQCKILYP